MTRIQISSLTIVFIAATLATGALCQVPTPTSDTDFNNDGRTDAIDLFTFLNSWFSSAGVAPVTGELLWLRRAGGSGNDDAYDVAVLTDGSSLVVGSYEGSAVFGEGDVGETTLTASGATPDIFVARYHPDGTLDWARRAGGDGIDRGVAISVLPDASPIWVVGHHDESATFGPGELHETILPGSGEFIASYGPDGSLKWAKHVAQSSSGSLGPEPSVAVLADGSGLVIGDFTGTALFGTTKANQTTLVADWVDVFIAKFNSNGSFLWAKRVGGGGNLSGTGVAGYGDTAFVITGAISSGTATFGLGESAETSLSAVGSEKAFVARYSPDGTLDWVSFAGGGDLGNTAWGVASLPDGSALVSGSENSLLSEEPPLSSSGAFVQKFGPDGTPLWSEVPGGAGQGFGTGSSVAANPHGEFVVAGSDAPFGFVTKYDTDSSFAWSKQMIGLPGAPTKLDAEILSDGTVIVTGTYSGTATFYESGTSGGTMLSDFGLNDIFVAKYAP
jgi:hypothetical protein